MELQRSFYCILAFMLLHACLPFCLERVTEGALSPEAIVVAVNGISRDTVSLARRYPSLPNIPEAHLARVNDIPGHENLCNAAYNSPSSLAVGFRAQYPDWPSLLAFGPQVVLNRDGSEVKGMPIMVVAIGADHAGFIMKNRIVDFLRGANLVGDLEVIDLGTHGEDPVDYPDYARIVGLAVQTGSADRGILICGSGVGASVAANKLAGVRAAICHDTYSAHQGVEHDNLNVLVLGARVVGGALAEELVTTFLGARFSGDERHVRRLKKVEALEH